MRKVSQAKTAPSEVKTFLCTQASNSDTLVCMAVTQPTKKTQSRSSEAKARAVVNITCCRKSSKAKALAVADTTCIRKSCSDSDLEVVYKNLPSAALTRAVYDQWSQWNNYIGWITEFEKNYDIDIYKKRPEVNVDPRAPIYGYNSDQTLDLQGGMAKTYSPSFKVFPWKYHTVTNDLASNLLPDVFSDVFEECILQYAQRGFQLANNDYPERLKGVYQRFDLGSGCNIALKLNLDSRGRPISVDLWAMISDIFVLYLDSYEPDQSKWANSGWYPIRIPVTTDFCGVFQTKYDVTPTAYFDPTCNNITVKVPSGSNIQTVRDLNFEYAVHLHDFEGTFALIRRDGNNKLVTATPTTFNYMVQNTSSVKVSSTTFIPPDLAAEYGIVVELKTSINQFVDATGTFTGMVLNPVGDGSSRYDVYGLPLPTRDYGAFVQQIDPYQGYENSDNPATIYKELYGMPSLMVLNDNADWTVNTYGVSPNVLAGKAYPEQMGDISLVPRFRKGTAREAYKMYITHELTHTVNSNSGSYYWVPSEALASATMQSRNIFPDTMVAFMSLVSLSHINFTRGIASPMQTDNMDLGGTIEFQTYGRCIFWNYIHEQFDFNLQVDRRVPEIINTEMLGPVYKAEGSRTLFERAPVSPVGGTIALNQALGELHNRNLPDVWTDFSISLALMRNNTSIPAKYQQKYPYWLSSRKFIDFPLIEETNNILNFTRFGVILDWWDQIEDNRVLTVIAPGQTYIRTLPRFFEQSIGDMRALTFNIPRGTTYVDVQVEGDWRLTMLQFTSDGTPQGRFAQDPAPGQTRTGSHRFDVTQFTAAGNIRLICVHVGMHTQDAGNGEDFLLPEPITGSIKIVRGRSGYV